MKLLVFWLLCTGIRAAESADRSSDCYPGDVSCIVSAGDLEVCVVPTERNCTTEIIRVVPTPAFVHVRKNEPVVMEFNVTSVNVTDVSVIVIYPDGSNVTLDDGESSHQVSTNASKAMDGSYVFVASGTYTDADTKTYNVCAAEAVTLYVFTVSVSLDKAFYAFKKDTTSIIYVTVESEAKAWQRIQLYEYAPISKVQNLGPINLDDTETVYTFHYQLPTPTKGTYEFEAEEFSLYGAMIYSARASAEVYVLTTDITVEQTHYHTEIGDNASIPLTVTTETAVDNITIQVVKPDGNIENVTDVTSNEPLTYSYNVYDVNISDLGEYIFSAYEIVNGQGQVLSSEITVEIYSYAISITTDLKADEGGRYIAIKGENSSIECQREGEQDQNVTWVSGDAEVTNSVDSAVYQIKHGSTTILYISKRGDFESTGKYICSTPAINISKTISVEGPPEQTTVVYANNKFTCKSNGNPMPSLVWRIDNVMMGDFFENAVDEDLGDFESTSTISAKMDLSCLGNQEIECVANNSYAKGSASMPVNDGTAYVFYDEYIIFRSKRGHFDDANTSCNGNLLILKGEGKISFVEKSAVDNSITEFYIGATKGDDSKWEYPDGSVAELDPEVNPENNAFSCAKHSLGNDNSWKSQPCDCEEQLAVVCQIKDTDPPSNLEIRPDECNGTILTIEWDPPRDVKAQDVTIDGMQTQQLLPYQNETTYDTLNEATKYTIKVEAIRQYCQLHPYVESSKTTTGPPSPPDMVQLESNGSSCKMTWKQSDDSGTIEAFMITVIDVAVEDPNDEFPPTRKTHIVDAGQFETEINMKPNTIYTASIYSRSCAGNSLTVNATGICESPIGTPSVVQHPLWVASVTDGTVETEMLPANNRAGPVSCQFMVVHYVGTDDSDDVDMTEERFEQIKQAGDPVDTGEEYFAYATTPLSASQKFTLGVGGSTDCIPLPVKDSNRRRRGIEAKTRYSAENRKLPYNVKFRYFTVSTVVDEEHQLVYMNKSISSDEYIVIQRDEPPTPGTNAGVVVLSIMVVLIFAGLVFFLFRRWRRPSNRPGFLRLSYSANSDIVYDTL